MEADDGQEGLPDGDLLSLWDFGSTQFLTHRLTGECLCVHGPHSTIAGGPFQLQLDGRCAVLVGPGSEQDQ